MKTILACAAALALTACKPADAPKPAAKKPAAKAKPVPAAKAKAKPKPKGSVHFTFPDEGAKVLSTFQIGFGVNGMTVVPAGQLVDDKTKGHHHLVVNGTTVESGKVVPKDEMHLHFGKGQTSTQLTLPPGKHSLTMQFADGAHISYGEALGHTIEVEVVEAKAKPRVFFAEPAEGAKVKSPFMVKFGVEGYGIAPAGGDPKDHTTGHHHVVVDGKPIPTGVVVPKDETHIHYGKGQTEAELTLSPGKHTLTLQLADAAHRSYGAEVSATINVEVE